MAEREGRTRGDRVRDEDHRTYLGRRARIQELSAEFLTDFFERTPSLRAASKRFALAAMAKPVEFGNAIDAVAVYRVPYECSMVPPDIFNYDIPRDSPRWWNVAFPTTDDQVSELVADYWAFQDRRNPPNGMEITRPDRREFVEGEVRAARRAGIDPRHWRTYLEAHNQELENDFSVLAFNAAHLAFIWDITKKEGTPAFATGRFDDMLLAPIHPDLIDRTSSGGSLMRVPVTALGQPVSERLLRVAITFAEALYRDTELQQSNLDAVNAHPFTFTHRLIRSRDGTPRNLARNLSVSDVDGVASILHALAGMNPDVASPGIPKEFQRDPMKLIHAMLSAELPDQAATVAPDATTGPTGTFGLYFSSLLWPGGDGAPQISKATRENNRKLRQFRVAQTWSGWEAWADGKAAGDPDAKPPVRTGFAPCPYAGHHESLESPSNPGGENAVPAFAHALQVGLRVADVIRPMSPVEISRDADGVAAGVGQNLEFPVSKSA